MTAPMARQWAARYCVRDASGCCCDYYHGFWQYLRLMGLGPTLGGHAGVYVSAMQDIARQWHTRGEAGARRVLISGCADYSMLAHVLYAFGPVETQPRITVLDVCPTPLEMNAWYAQTLGRPVELVCSDLRAHQAPDTYDLIVTSSFLGYFSPEARPGLFAAYATMLRDGGSLVFSNRLRPGPESAPTHFTPEQADRFARKVLESSRNLPAQAAMDESDAHRLALAYVANRQPYPVNSANSIERLAAHARLRWVRASRLNTAVQRPGISGPTLADGSDYLFVILEKQGLGVATPTSGSGTSPVKAGVLPWMPA